MALSQLLLQALQLMLIGMVSVAVFLGTLVLIIPLLNRLTPDEASESTTATNTPNNATVPSAAIVAAVTIAVQRYRNRSK